MVPVCVQPQKVGSWQLGNPKKLNTQRAIGEQNLYTVRFSLLSFILWSHLKATPGYTKLPSVTCRTNISTESSADRLGKPTRVLPHVPNVLDQWDVRTPGCVCRDCMPKYVAVDFQSWNNCKAFSITCNPSWNRKLTGIHNSSLSWSWENTHISSHLHTQNAEPNQRTAFMKLWYSGCFHDFPETLGDLRAMEIPIEPTFSH